MPRREGGGKDEGTAIEREEAREGGLERALCRTTEAGDERQKTERSEISLIRS